ncbi:MAG: hypothetical protein LUI05_07075 [Oscillospiraceae bacterium]|nr:hypothetical protein [Oscillospiraceae bacterium]
MNKNKNIGTAKIISILFCTLTVCLLAVLIGVKTYTGGQIKTISSIYTAVSHGIYDDYKECFAAGSDYLSEKQFDELCSDYERNWGEDFSLSVKYLSREKAQEGYNVTVKLTVYNEKEHENSNVCFFMKRQNGKWVIME